jgi:hypothetical protein
VLRYKIMLNKKTAVSLWDAGDDRAGGGRAGRRRGAAICAVWRRQNRFFCFSQPAKQDNAESSAWCNESRKHGRPSMAAVPATLFFKPHAAAWASTADDRKNR